MHYILIEIYSTGILSHSDRHFAVPKTFDTNRASHSIDFVFFWFSSWDLDEIDFLVCCVIVPYATVLEQPGIITSCRSWTQRIFESIDSLSRSTSTVKITIIKGQDCLFSPPTPLVVFYISTYIMRYGLQIATPWFYRYDFVGVINRYVFLQFRFSFNSEFKHAFSISQRLITSLKYTRTTHTWALRGWCSCNGAITSTTPLTISASTENVPAVQIFSLLESFYLYNFRFFHFKLVWLKRYFTESCRGKSFDFFLVLAPFCLHCLHSWIICLSRSRNNLLRLTFFCGLKRQSLVLLCLSFPAYGRPRQDVLVLFSAPISRPSKCCWTITAPSTVTKYFLKVGFF